MGAPMSRWTVQATKLRAHRIQEAGEADRADEVVLGLVWMRSRLGDRGSTRADFTNRLVVIDDVDAGETVAVPREMGRVAFDDVDVLDGDEVAAGERPELLVVVSIAVEHDATPLPALERKLDQLARSMKSRVGEAILERAPAWSDLDGLAASLAEAVDDVKDDLRPGFWEGLRLFLQSGLDPDDAVGYGVAVLVPVDEAAWITLGPRLTSAAGPTAEVLRLAEGVFEHRYVGAKAAYGVRFRVTG